MPPVNARVDILGAGDITDEYGQTVLDWSTPIVVLADQPAWLEQTATVENDANAETRGSTWALTVWNASAPITGRSRVRHGDDVFRVAGRPVVYSTPRGTHHIEAVLTLVEG